MKINSNNYMMNSLNLLPYKKVVKLYAYRQDAKIAKHFLFQFKISLKLHDKNLNTSNYIKTNYQILW